MLNADLHLKNEATATRKSRLRRGKQYSDESEAAFHFIAFVPRLGKVWKIDGLERQPESLGTVHDSNSYHQTLSLRR